MITIRELGKSYLLGHQESSSSLSMDLRESFTAGIRRTARNAWHAISGRQLIQGDTIEEFWAIKDINLDVNQGEVIGIIGRNGAGKSTLLKILSRITEPTLGYVTLRGRVASLLEVGTGFHSELTGRENVFLNGAILGMNRAEIRSKFDEIVEFAGVQRFLDTPVKRYSSGMYVRLAFAVAAHLEPEILVVDEVLAVGDADFQKKCLGKMQDVAAGGRTVLFVSHNMTTVRALTQKCVWLKSGRLMAFEPTAQAIDRYLSDGLAEATRGVSLDYFRRDLRPDSPVRIVEIAVSGHDKQGDKIPTIEDGEFRQVAISIQSDIPVESAKISLLLKRDGEDTVCCLYSSDGGDVIRLSPGMNLVKCTLPRLHLPSGRFTIGMGVSPRTDSPIIDVIQDYPLFESRLRGAENGTLEYATRPWGAVFLPDARWEVVAHDSR